MQDSTHQTAIENWDKINEHLEAKLVFLAIHVGGDFRFFANCCFMSGQSCNPEDRVLNKNMGGKKRF